MGCVSSLKKCSSADLIGLVPFWTKNNPDYGTLMRTINCRDDSLAENRGMWTSMKKRKRCIVICHGFYEWLKKNNGKEKIPHYIKRKDGKLMLFAGLWDMVQYEGSDDKLYTFTIITTDSNKQLNFLHDRMPVVLNPGSEELRTWLDPNRYEWSKELQSLLKPWDGELDIYAVTKEVGKVGNNSANFIVPVNSTENKKNIVNFFNKQAELAKSPKKPRAKDETDDVESSGDVKKESHAHSTEFKAESPPPSTAKSRTGAKRQHKEIVDIDDGPAAKKGQNSSSQAASSPSKGARKMRSATSNGTASKGSPKKAENSKKITSFFVKNST
jgi:putative SOS response-associated peptidase YedK